MPSPRKIVPRCSPKIGLPLIPAARCSPRMRASRAFRLTLSSSRSWCGAPEAALFSARSPQRPRRLRENCRKHPHAIYARLLSRGRKCRERRAGTTLRVESAQAERLRVVNRAAYYVPGKAARKFSDRPGKFLWHAEKNIELRLRSRTLELGARTLVMGVLNVTPDSFSDGGKFFDSNAAIAAALAMEAAGADILDIGGESTRPGSGGTSAKDELDARACRCSRRCAAA